ncbi:MAG: molybdopterin oxidoreductase family protein [Alcanivorax sp.]|nr:molybdopterin oxidoreductase family protein [Alcanivorax sp.]
MSDTQTHYRTCNLCEAMCGIEITHADGKIQSIRGDKEDPFSQGHICPKAVALQDIHEDPDRLRRPMARVGDSWQEISWKEALDRAAEGLQKVQAEHGRNAVASYLGNPNVHNTGAMLLGRLLHNSLKTRNRFSATSVDQLPHHIVAHHLFGHQLKIPVPDIDRTDFMLILGANPIASNGSIMTVPNVKKRLQAIQKRGGQVVVIDPRRTETAAMASSHHFIRPGADVLLLLAFINVLFTDNLVRHDSRALALCDDLDVLPEAVAPWTPERVAPLTGMDAGDIRQLVKAFCAAERAVCYGRMGVSVQEFGLLSQYLVMLINLLTGRLDEEGGMMFTRPAVDVLGHTGPGRLGRNHTRVRQLPDFGGEFPVSALAEEILTPGEGRIRALVTVAGNPVLSTPNGGQLDDALASLDFMVAIDFYLNETNRHADLILPPVSPLEREHYDVIFHMLAVRNTARYADALFSPPKDALHDWQIYLELADRMDPPKSLRDRASRALLRRTGPRGLLAVMLRSGVWGRGLRPGGLTLGKLRRHPHGIDLGPLTRALPGALKHADKRIHLHTAFYLPDLLRVERHFFGDDAIPPEQPLLIGRRHVRSNNSWLHNSHRLVKGKSRCTAMIHPSHAQALGVNEGDLLSITSRVGSIEVAAEITTDIMPGVVSVPHGWGHQRAGIRQQIAAEHPGVSVNDLTDDQRIDMLSGNAALNGVPVTVTRAHALANAV